MTSKKLGLKWWQWIVVVLLGVTRAVTPPFAESLVGLVGALLGGLIGAYLWIFIIVFVVRAVWKRVPRVGAE